MLVRVFTGVVVVVLLLAAPDAVGTPIVAAVDPVTAHSVRVVEPTDDTINEFLPEERGLGECISAVPKPGCGSEARGGWRQGVVLLSIIAGLSIIAWRVVAASRRARREATAVSSGRTPDATNARGDSHDGRSP